MLVKIFGFISLLLIAVSCNTTEPPPPPPNGNDNLEFTWEVDTLLNPNGYGVVPWSMWGSSPNDVWIAGFNLAGQGEIFHWADSNWARVTPDLGINYQVSSVYGSSMNDVYIAGAELIIDTTLHGENLLLHYNGVDLQEVNMPKGDGLLYVHGRNSVDIWACGYYGSLYHKTGAQWVKFTFDDELNLGPIYVAPNGNVFMMSFPAINPAPGDSATHYFWKYSNQIWEVIDSNKIYNDNYELVGYTFGNKAMYGVNENEIYSVGNRGLFRFNGNYWALTAWDDHLYRDIKGTSGNNIFTVGDHGTIRYYDGSSWKRIGDYSRFIVDFYSVIPFEDEIFIGAYQLGEGYVVHGKLKE